VTRHPWRIWRRFAESAIALGACAALASNAYAEEAKPATTTSADSAPKAAVPAKPVEPAKPEAAKPEAAKPAAATNVDAAKPAAPASAAPPASSATTEAEAVWRAYEKRWSETDDYAAGFRQTIEVPDVGSRVESAGRFYFAKPGLVRWEYSEGPPQTVVGDGTWIWLYQPDLEQVYKIPYAKAFGRGGLVELLAGREGVSGRYTTTLERPDPQTVRILLKSLQEGGGNLEVTLAADTFDLRGVVVHDAAGSITKMTFAEPRRNQGIDKARFTFTPPPAVDIIADSEAGF
jgi:outer membrane lipoprotein carrier protein